MNSATRRSNTCVTNKDLDSYLVIAHSFHSQCRLNGDPYARADTSLQLCVSISWSYGIYMVIHVIHGCHNKAISVVDVQCKHLSIPQCVAIDHNQHRSTGHNPIGTVAHI
jgi:hypothetical protein